MQTFIRHASPINTHAQFVLSRGRGTFQSMTVRNKVAKQLKLHGHQVRCGNIRNQQLHPEYVLDYVGELQTGFGNTQYQTFWSVLYTLEVV